MKLTILGCGSSPGVPMIGGAEGGPAPGIWGDCDPTEPRNRRSRSSVVIEKDNFRILIDCGPDFRSQMLNCGLSKIDAVIITHAHSDHIAGLDELRAVNREIERPIPIYAPKEVMKEVKSRFNYAFQPWNGEGFFRPVFIEHVIEYDAPLKIGPFDGWVFTQHHGRIKSLGIRFENFAYSTDVSDLPAQSLSVLKDLDLWVVGCLQYEPHPAHAWVARVFEWQQTVLPKKTILTHMGEKMDYNKLCNQLPKGIEPAWDGEVVVF
ncbi:MBL fold metallo-hydrolase [Aristophania vespae]|uniref:MBL fold metallo-hydrolase n=2 Tax=Aristophania vespae TaxID=2697033 RepID=A0A6P1NG20_9PROT|nr:MBL fold metallo-hydrolase [Aristophania vespae]